MMTGTRELLLGFLVVCALAGMARADGSFVTVEVPVKTLLARNSAITNSLTVNLVPVERDSVQAQLRIGDDEKAVSRETTYIWTAKRLGYLDVTHYSDTVALDTQYRVVRMEDPFPEVDYNDGSDFLVPVFAAAKDSRLGEYVVLDEYPTFRSWLARVAPEGENDKRTAVLNSPSAYGAYALRLNALPDAAPTSLTIEAIEPSASTSGLWDLVVSIPGLAVGSDATATELGRVFSVKGAEALDESAFDANKASVSFAPTGDGKVKATITPKDSAAKQFFLRVNLQY